MNHALEIMSALERGINRRIPGHPVAWFSGNITGADYHLWWRLGPQRLGDKVYDRVLTLEDVWLNPELQRTGIMSEFIERMLTGDPAPQIAMTHLHFKGCNMVMASILRDRHFTPYCIGDRCDAWHAVSGQKELPL